ncbi:MAG: hypothetical protein BGO78_14385 [Chloroflexi bacterium 44-23]|nr:MAG: hypothetical protein BGO78_14385 [Chloroflexi bacterium 44-23]
MTSEKYQLSADIPKFDDARAFLIAIEGESQSIYREMTNAIRGQRGSPQDNVNWTNPNEWIPDRLSGRLSKLSFKVWEKSNHKVNPRHSR